MAKNIMIYEGLVRKLYTEGIHLVEDEVIPMIKKEIINTDSLYYPSRGHFINMDYDTLLPTEEEATDYLNSVIRKRQDMIREYFTDSQYGPKDQKKLLSLLANISSCVYFNPEEIHPLKEMSITEFKELKKIKRKERKAKRK